MTPSELKYKIENTESHFFDRKTIKFFGDTMRNYGCCKNVVDTPTQKNVPVWELYRKKPVKHGLQSSAYFHQDNFNQIFKKIE